MQRSVILSTVLLDVYSLLYINCIHKHSQSKLVHMFVLRKFPGQKFADFVGKPKRNMKLMLEDVHVEHIILY